MYVQCLNMMCSGTICPERDGRMMKYKRWNTGRRARNDPIKGGRFDHGMQRFDWYIDLTYVYIPRTSSFSFLFIDAYLLNQFDYSCIFGKDLIVALLSWLLDRDTPVAPSPPSWNSYNTSSPQWNLSADQSNLLLAEEGRSSDLAIQLPLFACFIIGPHLPIRRVILRQVVT